MTPQPVRWATIDDVDELVRLRRVMFAAMGTAVGADDDDAMAGALRRGLVDGTFFAAVVDAEDADGLGACGIGMAAQRMPTPGNPSGRVGYIQSMVTDDGHRRRGYGRSVLRALLDRFVADGITRVDLHATEVGALLYRQEGFRPGLQPELRWVAGGLPPGTTCEP
jgi:GNAT superfamily N-acetyltransferase